VEIAAATELIHMATLMHDDVIDRSDSRRGRVSANAFFGNKITVLSGDYVLSRAFWLLAKDGDLRIIRLIADLTIAMSEGEALQLVIGGSVKSWEEYYWRIIRDKTATFLDVCCQCGSILAGGEDEARKALSEYGLNLGIAFQITDDILDITGDPAKTGKPVGSDLRDGKFTLPVLLALQNLPEAQAIALTKTGRTAQHQREGRNGDLRGRRRLPGDRDGQGSSGGVRGQGAPRSGGSSTIDRARGPLCTGGHGHKPDALGDSSPTPGRSPH